MGGVVLRQIAIAIATTLSTLLWMYQWIVIAGVVLSWVNPDPYNPIVRFIRNVTEPLFYQVRRWLPFLVVSGIDLSPIVVLLGIRVVQQVVVESLYALALRLSRRGPWPQRRPAGSSWRSACSRARRGRASPDGTGRRSRSRYGRVPSRGPRTGSS